MCDLNWQKINKRKSLWTLHRKEMKHPPKVIRMEGLYTTLMKGDKLWRSDQTKEKEFGDF